MVLSVFFGKFCHALENLFFLLQNSTVSFAVAEFDYDSVEPDDLGFKVIWELMC